MTGGQHLKKKQISHQTCSSSNPNEQHLASSLLFQNITHPSTSTISETHKIFSERDIEKKKIPNSQKRFSSSRIKTIIKALKIRPHNFCEDMGELFFEQFSRPWMLCSTHYQYLLGLKDYRINIHERT